MEGATGCSASALETAGFVGFAGFNVLKEFAGIDPALTSASCVR